MTTAKKLRFRILQFNAVVKSNHVALTLYPKLVFHQLGTIPTGFLNKKHPDITFMVTQQEAFCYFVQAIRSNKSNQYSTKIIIFKSCKTQNIVLRFYTEYKILCLICSFNKNDFLPLPTTQIILRGRRLSSYFHNTVTPTKHLLPFSKQMLKSISITILTYISILEVHYHRDYSSRNDRSWKNYLHFSFSQRIRHNSFLRTC